MLLSVITVFWSFLVKKIHIYIKPSISQIWLIYQMKASIRISGCCRIQSGWITGTRGLVFWSFGLELDPTLRELLSPYILGCFGISQTNQPLCIPQVVIDPSENQPGLVSEISQALLGFVTFLLITFIGHFPSNFSQRNSGL